MKLKTLIDVDRRTWGRVKDIATVRSIPVGSAAGILLSYALGISDSGERKGKYRQCSTTQPQIHDGVAVMTTFGDNNEGH